MIDKTTAVTKPRKPLAECCLLYIYCMANIEAVGRGCLQGEVTTPGLHQGHLVVGMKRHHGDSHT